MEKGLFLGKLFSDVVQIINTFYCDDQLQPEQANLSAWLLWETCPYVILGVIDMELVDYKGALSSVHRMLTSFSRWGCSCCLVQHLQLSRESTERVQ